jgi:hypothetical protein
VIATEWENTSMRIRTNEGTLLVLALLVLGPFMGGCGQNPSTTPQANVPRRPPTDGPDSTPEPAIAALQLIADYTKDQQAADEKYKNKVLLIEGEVSRSSRNAEDPSIFLNEKPLTEKAAVDGIQCFAGPASRNRLARLSLGQKVKVRGSCMGMWGIQPRLTACEVVEVGEDRAIAVSAAQLSGDYLKDPEAARKRYSGKTLSVEGVVSEVKTEGMHQYLTLAGDEEKGGNAPRVVLQDSFNTPLAFSGLQKGQKVKVLGDCQGKGDHEVWIEHPLVLDGKR